MSNREDKVAEKIEKVVLDMLRDSEHLDDAILSIGEYLQRDIKRILEVNMSKKVKQYIVDFTYECSDTGEDEIQRSSVHASSKSEAVIKAVNHFTDMFEVGKVTRERSEVEDERE